MNILFATSEATPFAKTGGLADVCGALPVELARLGHEVTVFLPAFRQVLQSGQPTETTGVEFDIPIGGRIVPGRLLAGRLPNSGSRVYFVEQNGYYDRAELYRDKGRDYDYTGTGPVRAYVGDGRQSEPHRGSAYGNGCLRSAIDREHAQGRDGNCARNHLRG